MAAATALPGASGNLSTFGAGGGLFLGVNARETAGAVASFRIREGTAAGKIILAVALIANASTPQYWFGPQGLYVNGDIYYEKVAGTIEGAVFTA